MKKLLTLEFPVEDRQCWRQFEKKERISQKGNRYVKHKGKIYVYRKRKPGAQIVSVVNGEWKVVGRVDCGFHLFIGAEDQLSYHQWQQTPEAREAGKKLLEGLGMKLDGA
ncbi:MAG: hypothetical protein U9O89_00270 [Thermoproteota archaeon]|nr:hypothetical protein [Thermoproteota archaeon]